MADEELTPQQKRAITYKENLEKRKALARENAARHKEERELVATAMKHILERPQDATPGLLVFAAEVLDHLDTGASIIPYRALKVLDSEPVDMEAFAGAVKKLEAISQQGGNS